MTVRVSIRVIANVPLSLLARIDKSRSAIFSENAEVIAAEVMLDQFSPNMLDAELPLLLERGRAYLSELGCTELAECQLEVSVRVSSDDDLVRPSLYVSRDTVKSLASFGAALDFDPY
jgi:hypothetical protein